MMKKIKDFLFQILYKPFTVFILCFLFLLVNVILDSTLFQIFGLNQDLRVIQNRINYIKEKNLKIKKRIKKSSNPDFVEKEARERLDYAGEEDLIFLFPDNL